MDGRKRFCVFVLDQSEHAAAETGAHHAGAIAAGRGPRLLDERVKLSVSTLRNRPRRLSCDCLSRAPELIEIPAVQRADERVHPRDLRIDVPAALRVA